MIALPFPTLAGILFAGALIGSAFGFAAGLVAGFSAHGDDDQ